MKKLLYVFDDINYKSGAQKVMLHQIKTIKNNYKISIFTLSRPLCIEELDGINIIGERNWKLGEILSNRCKEVLMSKNIPITTKIKRILYTIAMRVGIENYFLDNYLFQPFKNTFENFDTIIIVSEASKFRRFACNLKHPKKIQWIHTDYASWSVYSEWTRAVTRNDHELYQKMDVVVVLTEQIKDKMCKKIPEIKSKVVVIPNLIDGERILTQAIEKPSVYLDKSKFNFVTVGRFEQEKAFERILSICNRLKQEKKVFTWYLIGNGSEEKKIKRFIKEKKLEEHIALVGNLLNPYPIMKQCDCFVLLSKYEGCPVTIDEAMVLNLPVLASDVGGIKEQFTMWKAGTLVRETEEDIYLDIVHYMDQQQRKTTEVPYEVINQKVLQELFLYL